MTLYNTQKFSECNVSGIMMIRGFRSDGLVTLANSRGYKTTKQSQNRGKKKESHLQERRVCSPSVRHLCSQSLQSVVCWCLFLLKPLRNPQLLCSHRIRLSEGGDSLTPASFTRQTLLRWSEIDPVTITPRQ